MNKSALISEINWLILFAFLLSSPAYSQIPAEKDSTIISDSDSTITQSKKPTPLWRVSDDETAELIAEDFIDFTQALPNVSSFDFGSLGQFSPLTVRGSTPQGIRILFSEFNLQDPINGFINTTVLPINLIEDVVFIGSDSFAPYGVIAMNGIIQLQEFMFNSDYPYSKVQFRTGDWGYSDIGVKFGLPLAKSWNFFISGNRQEMDGFEPNRDHKGSRVFGKFSYQPHKNFEVSSLSFINNSEVEVPAPLFPDLIPNIDNAKRKENRFEQLLSLRIGDLQTRRKQLRVKVSFSRLSQKSFVDSLLFDNRSLSFGAAIQQELFVGNHLFAFGGALQLDDLKSEQLNDHSDQFGYLFLRDSFKISDRWRLGIQTRVEKHDDYSTRFTGTAHLHSKISSNSKIVFGIQRGVRYPSFAERFWPGSLFRGDSTLVAENGTVMEIGVDFNHQNKLIFKSSIFRNVIDDWIAYDFLPDTLAFGPINSGSRTISGIDFKFIWNYFRAGQLGIIGSYLYLEEDASVKQLQVPEFSVYSYLDCGRNLFEDFVFVKVRFIGRVLGRRFGYVYESGTSFPALTERHLDAIFDGQLSFYFVSAQFSVSMENIFDRTYQLVPGFTSPPRTIRFGIQWEFLD